VDAGVGCSNVCSLSAAFYGLGQNNNHIYLLAFDSAGNWTNGYDETPTRVAPNLMILPIINLLQ
jgi:hypothetical protein